MVLDCRHGLMLERPVLVMSPKITMTRIRYDTNVKHKMRHSSIIGIFRKDALGGSNLPAGFATTISDEMIYSVL